MQKKIDFFKILMCTSTLIETLENKLRQGEWVILENNTQEVWQILVGLTRGVASPSVEWLLVLVNCKFSMLLDIKNYRISKNWCGPQISWGEWLVQENTREEIRPSGVSKILRAPYMSYVMAQESTRNRCHMAERDASHKRSKKWALDVNCLTVPSLQYMR